MALDRKSEKVYDRDISLGRAEPALQDRVEIIANTMEESSAHLEEPNIGCAKVDKYRQVFVNTHDSRVLLCDYIARRQPISDRICATIFLSLCQDYLANESKYAAFSYFTSSSFTVLKDDPIDRLNLEPILQSDLPAQSLSPSAQIGSMIWCTLVQAQKPPITPGEDPSADLGVLRRSALQQIVRRCLDPKRSDQFRSVDELRAALKAFLLRSRLYALARWILTLVGLLLLLLLGLSNYHSIEPIKTRRKSQLHYVFDPPGTAHYHIKFGLLANKEIVLDDGHSNVASISSARFKKLDSMHSVSGKLLSRLYFQLWPYKTVYDPQDPTSSLAWSNGTVRISGVVFPKSVQVVKIRPALNPPSNKLLVRCAVPPSSWAHANRFGPARSIKPGKDQVFDLGAVKGNYLNLSPGDYILNELKIGYAGDIELSGKGPVRLFIEGDETSDEPIVLVSGSVNMKDHPCGPLGNGFYPPADFQVWYNGKRPIVIEHASQFSGVIYAPYAPVHLGDHIHFVGAIVADKIAVDGVTYVLFDRDLEKITDWGKAPSGAGGL